MLEQSAGPATEVKDAYTGGGSNVLTDDQVPGSLATEPREKNS
jgi:hypothetical protein